MSELTVVILAYNEEKSLQVLLPDLIEFCSGHDFQLVIVNDGSKDGTESILSQYRDSACFSFFTHKVNRGYGGAIKTGIANTHTKYVITIDADGQHDLSDVLALHQHIEESNADMIVGSRMAHKDASLYRSIGKNLIRWFAKMLMPIHIEDINSGIKIYDTKLAKRYI